MARRQSSDVPKLVHDRLTRDGAYDFGLGVVLRAPTDVAGQGGSASYRVEFRTSPVIPGKPLTPRRYTYARKLEAAYELAQQRFTEMEQRASGTFVEYHTDVPFGQVVDAWFDSPHPRWGDHYPDKVRSLLRNWVASPDIRVHWRSGAAAAPISDIPIGGLVADHFNQALEHVRQERAHRTYTEVHGLVVQILKWALANRYLRPSDGNIVDQLPLARDDQGDDSVGGTRAIPPEEIPPMDALERLVATARRLRDDRVAMIYILSFGGLRISECLALRNDDRFQLRDDDCWRVEVREQVHKTYRKLLPPKWKKRRWAFLPHWLTDDVQSLLADTARGALLFPSPGRRVRDERGGIERVGAGLYPYSNWHERVWTPIAARTRLDGRSVTTGRRSKPETHRLGNRANDGGSGRCTGEQAGTAILLATSRTHP